MELADTLDSKSSALWCVGSSPTSPTNVFGGILYGFWQGIVFLDYWGRRLPVEGGMEKICIFLQSSQMQTARWMVCMRTFAIHRGSYILGIPVNRIYLQKIGIYLMIDVCEPLTAKTRNSD